MVKNILLVLWREITNSKNEKWCDNKLQSIINDYNKWKLSIITIKIDVQRLLLHLIFYIKIFLTAFLVFDILCCSVTATECLAKSNSPRGNNLPHTRHSTVLSEIKWVENEMKKWEKMKLSDGEWKEMRNRNDSCRRKSEKIRKFKIW